MPRPRRGPSTCSDCWNARRRSKPICKRINRICRPTDSALSSDRRFAERSPRRGGFGLRLDHYRRPARRRGPANRQHFAAIGQHRQSNNSTAAICSPVRTPARSPLHLSNGIRAVPTETILSCKAIPTSICCFQRTSPATKYLERSRHAAQHGRFESECDCRHAAGRFEWRCGRAIWEASKYPMARTQRIIDLSKASTLGDVKELLEAQPADGTLPPAAEGANHQ